MCQRTAWHVASMDAVHMIQNMHMQAKRAWKALGNHMRYLHHLNERGARALLLAALIELRALRRQLEPRVITTVRLRHRLA